MFHFISILITKLTVCFVLNMLFLFNHACAQKIITFFLLLFHACVQILEKKKQIENHVIVDFVIKSEKIHPIN